MICVRLLAARNKTNKWGEGMNHSDFHHDVLPCYANDDCMSPYEARTGKKPDLSRLRAFGELCFVLFKKSEKQPL